MTALSSVPVRAQQSDLQKTGQNPEEVLFTFNYQAIGQVYVTTLYDPQLDQIYLPVNELFSLLEINHEINSRQQYIIDGHYLHPDNSFRLNFKNFTASLNEKSEAYNKSLFRIREVDYFIAPHVLKDLFCMYFEVNMNRLSLSLEADDMMPVVERKRREEERESMQGISFLREEYPLLYNRSRSVFMPGLLDYSVSTINTLNREDYYNYSITGGIEFLGGDLQGTHLGGFSSSGNRYFQTRDLRWRYVIRENPYISQLAGGQVRTSGLQSWDIRGVSLSNDPVEPRQLQTNHIVEGTTEPDSEVELYVGNTLVDYTRADALGTYRFEVPLRYGTTRLRKQIYTPDGNVIVDRERIRTPFQFLPPGVITYNIEGGIVEPDFYNYLSGSPMVQGNVSMGLNSWLTAKAGTEYIEDTYDYPFLYGSLSGRLSDQYLLNVDLAPDALYRFQSSVIYPSSRSLSARYTHYTGPSIYNRLRADHQIEGNFYNPFQLAGLNAGFRIGGEHLIFQRNSYTRYTGDLYFRMGRLNLRLNYRDNIFFFNDDTRYGTGQLSGSATYVLPRNKHLPSILQGAYLRMSAHYERSQNQFRRIDFQVSKNIINNGRLYVGASQDFQTGLTRIQAGLSINFGNRVRSSTAYRGGGNNHSIRQNLRGSIGFDNNTDKITFSERQQAGDAAASVVLYTDNNNSDSFDAGDDILPYGAVSLDRTSNKRVGEDGVVRLTQLQSYYRYNLEVDRDLIPNPLLVPSVKEFSFIADPNQYKRIEIPFYRSGVIEGSVSLQQGESLQKRGGIRLLLRGIDNEYSKIIRTFHGGEFYAMDIPPGRYSLQVDPVQQDLLNLVQRGRVVKFELEPLAEGDFIEGIEIVLAPSTEE
ncbi:hypothetical protein [Fodinibius salsisoli]|uniref:Outer membrane usher protein FimD/PapC n=1 Tax=Fodinibius salsisoli TaxID=2820877 RepID=A0ABT3PK22_9BACT|nr:hypothetical protein [Fodinibius salsisoli]MCW9706294.1 hypothetical protein [Fodinibius salsisoli]